MVRGLGIHLVYSRGYVPCSRFCTMFVPCNNGGNPLVVECDLSGGCAVYLQIILMSKYFMVVSLIRKQHGKIMDKHSI